MFSKQDRGLELLRPGDTRCGTHFIMLERMLKVRPALQQMAFSTDWEDWQCGSSVKKTTVTEILTSCDFWKAIALVVKVTSPIFVLLRLLDSGKPTMGKFYAKMEHLVTTMQEMEGLTPEQRSAIVTILQDRWRLVHSPLHCAGYVLDPEYRGCGQERNSLVMQEFKLIRNKFFPSVQDQVAIEKQLVAFRHGEGMFSDPAAVVLARESHAHVWWESYGQDSPQLQFLATKILSQVTVVSSCDRNWSAFEFIYSKRRNILSVEKAVDLVFVFSTLHLKNKVFDREYKEEYIEWNDSEEYDSQCFE